MRIVFMGTPEFGVPILERLLSGGYEVVAVYTQPDKPVGRGRAPGFSPVKRAALEHGLTVIQPFSLRDPGEVDRLAGLKPDIIGVAAYGQILSQKVLDIPPLGCLNVHPSLLPRHRGASPVATAILAGDEETGVTIMLMDKGLDTGPILAQSRVPIERQATTGTLTAKLAQIGAQLLEETLPRWMLREIEPQPQDEREATYSRPISKQDGEIDWELSATEIWRQVRAFDPWPGCYTYFRGRLLKVLEAISIPSEKVVKPGRVVRLGRWWGVEVGIETGDGVLGICRVQLEGKRPMAATEFLRGQRDFVGEVLPSASLR